MSFSDIISKLRELFSFSTIQNTTKRRAEGQADYSTFTKYRRVTSEFPKVISKPFEDDMLYFHPGDTKRVAMTDAKSSENNSKKVDPKRNCSRPKIPIYAEVEFSDSDDDIALTIRNSNPLAMSSFNTNIKPRRSLLTLGTGKKTQEDNIPSMMAEKKPPPPLIETRTKRILGPKCIPNLQPIRKNTWLNLINPVEYTNRNLYSPSNRKENISRRVNNERKPQTSFYTKNPKSVVEQTYNLKEREGYMDLLAKLVPNLYKYSNNRSSDHRKILSTDTRRIIDRIDLSVSNKNKPKLEGVITIDDDEDNRPKEVIDLDNDDIQIISACRKLDQNKPEEAVVNKKELPPVKPVNTFKDKLDLLPTLQPQWVENIRQKYEQSNRERKKQIEEAEENVRKSTEETEKNEKLIEQKLKGILLESETIILDESEPEEEEAEFPELTSQDIEVIKHAIYKGPHDEILINKFNIQIRRHDINTLVGDRWLNDEVINFYMNLLIERGEQRSSEGLPRVYAMNTFFIPRLMQSGHAGVRRWTRKVDIFSYDIIPIPVHVGGVHWCMAIIHLKNKTIKYYDSMGTPNPRVLQILENYLKEESLDKKKIKLDTSNLILESVADVPRQMNGSDCGVFSCMFAEYITRNKEITFSQQHMPYFRQKMILEIVQGRLLL